MQIKKLLKCTMLSFLISILPATTTMAAIDITDGGFEAVSGFGGNEYGAADLIMPGPAKFSCPDLALYNKVIFVGDSRTVHTSRYVSDDRIAFVASSGQGLYWLKKDGGGKDQLMELLADSEYRTPLPKAIVFNLGVNDLENKDNYISYMKSLAPKLINRNCTLYYMSVNPVDNQVLLPPHLPRPAAQIKAFNTAIRQQLKDFRFIDSFTYLQKASYQTIDGLHYDTATYRKIFDYALSKVNARKPSTTNVAWEQRGNYWYASNASGSLYKNRWIDYEGGKFHLNSTGRLDTNKWLTTSSGKKYYVGPTGRYYTSQWVKTGGKYYYLQSNGVMATNTTIDGFVVDSTGAWISSL